MSYEFWCTPCKVRHGGECPPAASVQRAHVIQAIADATAPGALFVTCSHRWHHVSYDVDLMNTIQCVTCGVSRKVALMTFISMFKRKDLV